MALMNFANLLIRFSEILCCCQIKGQVRYNPKPLLSRPLD